MIIDDDDDGNDNDDDAYNFIFLPVFVFDSAALCIAILVFV